MLPLVRLIAVVLSIVSAISCGRKKYDEHIRETPVVEKISVRYDSGVPGWQKDLLEGDLDNLSRLNVNVSNAEYANIIGLSEINASQLNRWLSERLKVIVGEDFQVKYRYSYKQRFTSNPEAFSETYTPLSAAVTNAENTGGLVYLKCKPLGYICDLNLMDGTAIEVRTPRVGVVRIGEGLFSPRVEGNREDRAASFVRLGTLFHEAGHTNGNGAHVCFAHAKCPPGHAYYDPDPDKGYACDEATNGPYPIGVTILKILYEACGTSCNARQKEQLAGIIADYETRRLDGHTYKDPRPERIP